MVRTLLVAAVLLAPAPIAAQLLGAEVSASVDLSSRFVWRGLAMSDGAVLQSEVGLERAGFSLVAWANLPLAGDGWRSGVDELDLALGWAGERGGFELEALVQSYHYPGGEAGTIEVMASASRQLGGVALFTRHALDVRRFNRAWFGEAGAALAGDVRDVAVDAEVALGWGSSAFHDAYVGAPVSGLSVARASLGCELAVGPVVLRGHLDISRLLDPDLRRLVEDSTLALAGIAVRPR